jgi:hypothetical protein
MAHEELKGNLNDSKTTNQPPKTQLQLVPPVLEEVVAKALEVGAKKYGAWNWREEGRSLSTMEYVRAIRSHLNKYIEGDDYDEEGQHHLGAIGATCAILLDAGKVGNLKDDRPKV